MRRLIIALAAACAAEGAAVACVCIPVEAEEQRREVARRIAENAVAVAEVVQVQPMDQQAMRPELYRVVRVLFGKAPPTFRLERQMTRGPTGEVGMVMTSCDVVPAAGERTLVVLYEPRIEREGSVVTSGGCPARDRAAAPAAPTLAIGGTCDFLFVRSEGALDLIRQEARRLGKPVGR